MELSLGSSDLSHWAKERTERDNLSLAWFGHSWESNTPVQSKSGLFPKPFCNPSLLSPFSVRFVSRQEFRAQELISEWADMEQLFGIFKVNRDTQLTLMLSGLGRQQAKPFQVFGSKSSFRCSSWALKPFGLCSPVPSLGSAVPGVLGCGLNTGVQSTLFCDHVYTKLLILALCSSHSHGTVNLTWKAFSFLLQSSLKKPVQKLWSDAFWGRLSSYLLFSDGKGGYYLQVRRNN